MNMRLRSNLVVLLRVLLAAEIALGWAGMAASFLMEFFVLSEENAMAFEWAQAGGIMDPMVFGVPEEWELYFILVMASPLFVFSAVQLLASVGLFFLQWWARWLYLASTVVWLGSVPFFGIQVYSAPEELFYALATYCNAGVLYLCFLSPVRRCLRLAAPKTTAPAA